MKIIAIDSSGLVASVAIVEDDIMIAEYSIQYRKTHSQTLLPMLDEIRRMTELSLDTVKAIAVASGPGSFTGLRIGSATAKGMGEALGIPLIEIPTLDGLAYNLYGTDQLVCPMMDARRGQVYTGVYEYRKTAAARMSLSPLVPPCAVAFAEITAQLNELGREVILLGDGAGIFAEDQQALLTVPFSFAPPHMNRQRAASLAALAQEYIERGEDVNAAAHVPFYLRVSQAERVKQEGKAKE
jgi:tRNA threonylcarbamoyladenosine biosynthesis protein TsaB